MLDKRAHFRMFLFRLKWLSTGGKGDISTARAASYDVSALRAFLEKRFLAFGKAICTQMMWWLTLLHTGLRAIGRHARSDFGKMVAFRLSIPVFQLSNFFFQVAYALGERRLLLLGCQRDSPSVSQLGVHLGDCGDHLVEISKGLVRLYKIRQHPDTLENSIDLGNHENTPISCESNATAQAQAAKRPVALEPVVELKEETK